MINSVTGAGYRSNVNFKAQAYDPVTAEMISTPGKFSNSADNTVMTPSDEGKKSGMGGFTKFLIGALVVVAGAIAARKTLMKDYVVKTADDLADAKFMEKTKNAFAKTCDSIYDNTVGKLSKMWKDHKEKKAAKTDAPEVEVKVENKA